MRFCSFAFWVLVCVGPSFAGPVENLQNELRSEGVKVKLVERAGLNRRTGFRHLAAIGEKQLIRDLARISKTSALEEAYIHLDGKIALETGVMERFEITTSDCLVRATVRSSITVGLLAKMPNGLPADLVWYHVHPSRDIINKRFRAKRCAPPNTWPVLPSSADFSQFMKRAKKYYAAKPNGRYRDRIVVYPVGVIELSLTDAGRAAIREFRHRSNYDTQEYGNDSMPGHAIWPQKYIQRLNMLIDRIPKAGPQLDRNIKRAVDLLSSDVVRVSFIPIAMFQADP